MGNVTSGANPLRARWQQSLIVCGMWFMLAVVPSLHAQSGTSISARFSAVKGVVKVSLSTGGEKTAQKGDSIRSGSVITSGATSGASLKPIPGLYIIVYPDTKIRFDKASLNADGGGGVMCSILAGKALFHVDESTFNSRSMAGFGGSGPPNIKVTVVTDEGVIINNMGGRQQSYGGGPQTTIATWTVQHDEGRTVVAVGEGTSNVSIGKGAAASSGEVGGQVSVPQGSVLWLFSRGGKVDAELVDTQTGKTTNLTGGSSGGGALVEQSRQQIVSPSSSGGNGGSGGSPGGSPSPFPTGPPSTPTIPSSNPDLSTPQKPLPVVSADTP